MCAKTGIDWERFVEWAKRHDIEFRFPEDYEPFWRCWLSFWSVTAGLR